MEFYRYEDIVYADIGVRINERKFKLLKETPCGYWILPDWGYNYPESEEFKRWVSKVSKKRFAYPTKEEALVSYMARKKRQIEILKSQLKRAEIALGKSETLYEKNIISI
jgi:hypothetical protein